LYDGGLGPNIRNYGDYFHSLVYLEEYAEKKKMQRYNMANVPLKIINMKWLQLEVSLATCCMTVCAAFVSLGVD
jgi:hypothetical protein